MTAAVDVVEATVLCEEPGVYRMTEQEYHADPVTAPGGSLSRSGARLLLPPSCPARFAYERDHPPPPKDTLELGSAAHRVVLGTGPDLEVVDGDRWDTKAAKEHVAAIRARGDIPLKQADLAQVAAMATAIRAHPLAGALLNPEHGTAEQTLIWTDAETGIWRRARLDFIRQPGAGGRMIITDYKSAAAADRDSIRKAVVNYGYHMQADWYAEAVRALGLDDDPGFVFIFQEKTPPYLVNVVQLDPDAVAAGRDRNRLACEIFRDCTQAGIWPGYCDYDRDPDLITLPPWATRPIEDLYA